MCSVALQSQCLPPWLWYSWLVAVSFCVRSLVLLPTPDYAPALPHKLFSSSASITALGKVQMDHCLYSMRTLPPRLPAHAHPPFADAMRIPMIPGASTPCYYPWFSHTLTLPPAPGGEAPVDGRYFRDSPFDRVWVGKCTISAVCLARRIT
jgi:hypothetical protein